MATEDHPLVKNNNKVRHAPLVRNSLGPSLCCALLVCLRSAGSHTILLKFARPPEETDAAHSVELISGTAVYDDSVPSLSFELPNVINCVAEFVVDFDQDQISMRCNDGYAALQGRVIALGGSLGVERPVMGVPAGSIAHRNSALISYLCAGRFHPSGAIGCVGGEGVRLDHPLS